MLMGEDSDGIHEIFDAAMSIEDSVKRDQFLKEACGADQSKYDRVLELLASLNHADSFLEPKLELSTQFKTRGSSELRSQVVSSKANSKLANPLQLDIDSNIGPYRLVEQIGSGGIGVVYLAEQQHPITRSVAIKLIKPGMNSAQVVERFENERQALAILNHETIAKILDAGAAPNGLPYFVMEYVSGSPLNQYCDNHRLTIEQRLQIFKEVLLGVQHAHQRGVLH